MEKLLSLIFEVVNACVGKLKEKRKLSHKLTYIQGLFSAYFSEISENENKLSFHLLFGKHSFCPACNINRNAYTENKGKIFFFFFFPFPSATPENSDFLFLIVCFRTHIAWLISVGILRFFHFK